MTGLNNSSLARLSTPPPALRTENLASPDALGAAIGAADPADPIWAPLQFEIETVINMNQIAGGNNGAFVPDDGMPGNPIALSAPGILSRPTSTSPAPLQSRTRSKRSTQANRGWRPTSGSIEPAM